MTSFVSAAEEWTANFTGAGGGDGTSNLNYNGPEFVYATNGKNITYMPHMRNVQLTFRIWNYNATSNITNVNITLPSGVAFISDSNTTSVIENASILGTSFTVGFADNSNVLTYSNTTAGARWTGENFLIRTNGALNVTFNVSVNTSSDGSIDFTVTSTFMDGSSNRMYTVDDYITVDTTAPTLSSAITVNKTSINLTFSENMSLVGINLSANFNVTRYDDQKGTYNVTTKASTPENTKNGVTGTYSNLIVMPVLTESYFAPDETPYIGLDNFSLPTITLYDRANNSATVGSVQATDGAGPTLLNATFISSTKQLILDFDEDVSAVSTRGAVSLFVGDLAGWDDVVNISLAAFAAESVTTTNRSIITVADIDRDNISRWGNIPSLNISLINRTFITDGGGNLLQTPEGSTFPYTESIKYVKDSVAATLVNWTYNHVTRNITLGFSEVINSSSLAVAQIVVSNKSDHSAGTDNTDLIVLDTLSTIDGTDKPSVVLQLAWPDIDTIAAWGRNGDSTLYISMNYTSAVGGVGQDLYGNTISVSGAVNTSAKVGTTWTKDTTAPYVLSVKISDPNVTSEGTHRFIITFNENITNVANFTFKLTKGSTAITSGLTNLDVEEGTDGNSIWYANYTFNSLTGDGQWNFTLRGATDISGNAINTTAVNWTYPNIEFTLDTGYPQLLYAYYVENGSVASNGTLNNTRDVGDTLVLVFNEVLTPRTIANFSLGNLTFSDGLAFGTTYARAEVPVNSKSLKLISQETPPTLKLRGDTLVGFFSNVSLKGAYVNTTTLNSTNTSYVLTEAGLVQDLANHTPLNSVSNSSNVMIADYALELVNNTRTTISFPAYPNATMMANYLPATTRYSFIDWVNEAQWGSDIAVGSLQPLVGYRFLWSLPSTDSGDRMFRFYLLNSSSLGVQDVEVTVDSGWNFLASDGLSVANPDRWLRSLCDNDDCSTSDVASFVTYNGLTSYADTGTAGFTNWNTWATGVAPYTGYWVNIAALGTSTTQFTGRGIK